MTKLHTLLPRVRPGLLAVALLALGAPALHAEPQADDFFGEWVPVEERDRSCGQMGENAHFTVYRDFYMPGDGASCDEARTWVQGGRLRISATCEGEEYGFRATTRELVLDNPTTVRTTAPGEKKASRYVLCTMPKVRISEAQARALLDAKQAAETAYSSVPDNAPQGAPDAAETKAAREHGFASTAQLRDMVYIAEDILRTLDAPGYLGRRHDPHNVAVVRANRDRLAPLIGK